MREMLEFIEQHPDHEYTQVDQEAVDCARSCLSEEWAKRWWKERKLPWNAYPTDPWGGTQSDEGTTSLIEVPLGNQ